MIAEGTYPRGTLLPPERELMRLFGIERPSIREALFALNRMGLVTISSGERVRITTPTPDRLITELSGAVRHFLTHLRLDHALRPNAEARGDASRFERTDVGFHYVLATMTGNPIFTAAQEISESIQRASASQATER